MRRACQNCLLLLVVLLIVSGCGQTQESALATRAASTVGMPTMLATPHPTIATDDDAIRVARTVASPYIATWQDVVATRENGIWRVTFRGYDPIPKGTAPNDDYWRVPFSVFVDAATGIVLRQGFIEHSRLLCYTPLGGKRSVVKQTVKLVIASGGTGGHTSPTIAVLNLLRERGSVDATWIGGTWGVEREAATRAGVPFIAIPTGKLRRYLSWRTPIDAVRLPLGYAQAYRHLRRIRPAVVFSTGGYVAVPTALAAARLGIPVLTHEQTAQLGLATRIIARSADVLALSFPLPEATQLAGNARLIVTGNPVRASLLAGDATRGAARFGLSTAMPTIYVTGGARGSSPVNERVERALPLLLPTAQIIHATGPTDANGDYPRLRAVRDQLPDDWRARYVVIETLGDELRDVYALAALVIGRSGAGTVAELAALGKPSILIPLPGTGGDEATKNARVLADAKAAILLPQSEATPELLASHVLALLNDHDRRARMSEAARALAPTDAAEKIADALLDLASRPAPETGD